MIRNLGKLKSVGGLNSRVQRAFPRLVKSVLSSPGAFLDSRHRQGIKLAIGREFCEGKKNQWKFWQFCGIRIWRCPKH